MHIFVGSTNPVKINAVTTAASETWPDVRVQGLDVPSGISEQPIGDEETLQGAINRAKMALDQGLESLTEEQLKSDQMIGVGLEGGVFHFSKTELWSTVWVAVVDTEGTIFTANGARFRVPDSIAERILTGGEMGPIVERLVGEADVRSKQGMIGIITQGFVDRAEEYAGITKMAIGLWYGRDWERELRVE